MNFKNVKRIITPIMSTVFATVCVAVIMPSVVKAEDFDPVLAAQQAALQAEQARIEQQMAAQAASDAAVANAQLRAKQEAASALYAQWGEVPAEFQQYLNGGTGDMTTSAITATTPQLTTTAKVPTPSGIVVDLVIFAGQSNMSGAGGNAKSAPFVANGAGYEFRAISDPTGLYPVTEPFGAKENAYIGDGIAGKHGSLVSSFINTYYKSTGVPVVAISASQGATDTNFWSSKGARNDLNGRFIKAKTFLAANNITVRKQYLVWLQGESDAVSGITPAQYVKNLNAAFSPLFTSGLNQVFIITPGYTKGGIYFYDGIINAQKSLCASNGFYSLGSATLRELPETYLSDQVHYNQTALNMVGAEAARAAAVYTNATLR